MKFNNISGNIVYYAESKTSVIYGVGDFIKTAKGKNKNVRNVIINGDIYQQSLTVCVSGVINKIEYEVITYNRKSTLNGEIIDSLALDEFKSNFIKEKIKTLTIDTENDELDVDSDLYDSYENIARNMFNTLNIVGYINEEIVELIDITDLFTMHTLDDIVYDKNIEVYLTTPLADTCQLKNGIYMISGTSIYLNTVNDMCKKYGLSYEKGYSLTSDKINGQYYLKDDKYNFGLYQFNKYSDAVLNVDRLKKYFEDIIMVAVDKYFSNTTKINIIYTLETIRKSVLSLDVKQSDKTSRYVVLKKFDELINELRQSSYKDDVDENKLVEIILKKSY